MWGARFNANHYKPEDQRVPQKRLTGMKGEKLEKEKERPASRRLKEFRHLDSKRT